MKKIDPRSDVIPILEMYSRLAHRIAGEAQALALEANALHVQLDATLMNLIVAQRKHKSWWQFWK